MSKNNQVSKEWCDECKECRSYSRQSIDHTCPCHTKEVEEKCVCNDLPDIPHKHNDGRVIIPYQHTPKVATSEKGNKYRSPRQIGCNHCPTPHESEDWEAGVRELVKGDWIESLILTIKGIESKSYQRGREERDEFWKNQEMGVATDCWKHAESAKFDVLSFAVQEIEKEKKELQEQRDTEEGDGLQPLYFHGKLEGLDKAKEIIHSLASLKKE